MENTAGSLFESIPYEDKLNLFEDAEPDAKKVIDFLRYKKRDVAAAASVPIKSVRYDKKMPSVLREHLRDWAVAINLVANFFNDEQKAILWFQTDDPLLGNVSPKAMIRAGRFKKLLRFIQTAIEENSR